MTRTPGLVAAPGAALLLDIDDTLIDTRTSLRAAAARCLREVWPELTEAQARELGVRYHVDPEGYFVAYTRGDLTFEQQREGRLRAVVDDAGLAWSHAAWQDFETAWAPAFTGATIVFDDVRPLLERAAAAGVLVGALTNSSETFTSLKLKAGGLADAFSTVATTDTLGFGKPDPRAFHEACRLLGAVPERTVYVGDALDVDAVAAAQAGLTGVWLDRRGETSAPAPPEVTRVSTLDEITFAVP